MNSVVKVPSGCPTILPPGNRDQLPAVVARPLPPSTGASKPVADSLSRQSLKFLAEDPHEPVASDVIDLQFFRSVFFIPLGHLRGALIAAYRWAEKLSLPAQTAEPIIDLYV